MEERVQHQIHVIVLLDIQALNVKHVCNNFCTRNRCIHVCLFFFLYVLAICSLACQNGGTCSAPDTCDCILGYNGTVCETRMFSAAKNASVHIFMSQYFKNII